MLLRSQDVAKLLGISPATVYRMAEAGKIGHYKVGGCIRFAAEDVEAYLARARREPEPDRPAAPPLPAPMPAKYAQTPLPTKKRGPGRPRKGGLEISGYVPGMKVV